MKYNTHIIKTHILREANMYNIDNEEMKQAEYNTKRLRRMNPMEDDNGEEDQQNNETEQTPENMPDDMSDEETQSQENDDDIPDDGEVSQEIPDMKILNTLSDKEYLLSNMRVINQLKDLKRNINGTIKNIVMKMGTRDRSQAKVLDMIYNNFNDMIDDIDVYITYKNNDVYETNVVAYLTFLKRYQIGCRVLRNVANDIYT